MKADEKRLLLERQLPALPTQRFHYPEQVHVVLGKVFPFDERLVYYPDSVYNTVTEAVAHLFELAESDQELMMPLFMVNLDEPEPTVQRLRYFSDRITIGDNGADLLLLAELNETTLRTLIADLLPSG